jgi:hypothetical protein
MLELIAGAKEFKLGFSGMRLTQAEMASNIKVRCLVPEFVIESA